MIRMDPPIAPARAASQVLYVADRVDHIEDGGTRKRLMIFADDRTGEVKQIYSTMVEFNK